MQCENKIGVFRNIFALQSFHVFVPAFSAVSFLCCSVNAVSMASSQSCLVAKKLVRFIGISDLSDDI